MLYLLPIVLSAATSLYACENVRAMGAMAKTNRKGQNAFRAPGMTEGITALEQAMDELAVALELDPLELRRLNHTDVDPVSGAAVLGQALARVLRPGRRAGGLGCARASAQPAARRPAARNGLCVSDLVGLGRPAGTRDRSHRRLGARTRDHGHSGHRDGDADGRTARRRRGARPSCRPRASGRRRHGAEPVRACRGWIDDGSVGHAGGPGSLCEGTPS